MAVANHRKKRRYLAARTILLSQLTHERLGLMDRLRVAESVREYINHNALGLDPAELVDWTGSAARAALRAVAMDSLGIPPGIEGEEWELPKKYAWQLVDSRVAELVLNYHPSDLATERARAYLADKGVEKQALT